MLTARWIGGAVLAADQAAPLVKQMNPEQRASVLLALAGLVILGCAMLALVWLGAHHVRHLARQRPRLRERDMSDWQRQGSVDENDEERSTNDE